MKKIYLGVLAVIISLNAFARMDFGLWCDGQVVLENGEVLEGNLSYDLKYEVVRIKSKGLMRAYTAESIAYFELYDPIAQLHRKFVSFEYPLNFGYQRQTFLEVIAHGDLSMLRKSEYVRRPRATEDMRAPHIFLNNVCKHTYFMHKEDEGLMEVHNFKEEVLPKMQRYRTEVNSYIKKCDLKLKKLHEQVRVVNLYNQLHAMDSKLAKSNIPAEASPANFH